jgi:integrase
MKKRPKTKKRTKARAMAPRAQKTVLDSRHGKVIIYVRRHINGCELSDSNQLSCCCPKWLYVRQRGGKAVQRAAGCTSFTEANALAQKILDGLNPEVAAAREINEPTPGIDIESCVDLYRAALSRRSLSASHVHNCLVPFQRRDPAEYKSGRAKNMSLLDWLARQNIAARVPVTRMEQVTSDILDKWLAGWESNDLTTRVWRGNVVAFMRWAKLHDHLVNEPQFRERHKVRPGNRCGHLDDGQIAKLYQSIPFFKPLNAPENHAARLTAFIDAGRHGGMAVVDIVAFEPKVSLSANNILTYRRKKSGVIATVLLDPAVAARLRSIPPEAGSDPDKPFRLHDTLEVQNRQLWRERFKSLCEFAGIDEVETEVGRKVKPHPQQLRDSLAISAITHGVSLENVARMLGHASTAMTQRSYLFWVKQRVDYCVEDQRLALARRAQEQPEVASPDAPPPTIVN